MNNYIKLAWRNIWRNKRRTLITTASVFFGVILSTFMTSMQEGSYEQYINSVVNFYSGYLQIHKKGYWDDQIINNSFVFDETLKSKISMVEKISSYTRRFETYALGSSEDLTKGVMVIGIDPEVENKITRLEGKIKRGKYLKSGDDGVLIGSELAKFMNLKILDTIVLIGQGYHGTSATGKYPVRGILQHPSPLLDRILVYMDLENCQELFSAENLLTSAVLMVDDKDDMPEAKKELINSLGSDLEVKDWKEMNDLLMKQLESDRSSAFIMKGVLYLIIACGILGTIIMMMAERRKEFGVLIAVGMKKYKIIIMMQLETIFIGAVGTVVGIAGSIPLVYYFLHHPIPLTGQAGEMMLQMGFDAAMFFSVAPPVFYYQALTIFIFTLIIGIYPIINISRLNVIKALKK